MAKKLSTAAILKAYEKFGDMAVVATLFKIEDWEVLAALSKASPSFLLGIAVARTLDALVETLTHLRRRVKTGRTPKNATVARDLGKLLAELQSKRAALGGETGSGLNLSEEEEKSLRETINALGEHGDSGKEDGNDG